MGLEIIRTDSGDSRFSDLVVLLDADLARRDGAEHAYYAKFNKIDSIPYAIVVVAEGIPVGCGAMKAFGEDKMEVKRMYVKAKERGKGIAQTILNALEAWAIELGAKSCVLETGKRQPEAIRLYTKAGYSPIPNYGQYQGIDNSRCFSKKLEMNC